MIQVLLLVLLMFGCGAAPDDDVMLLGTLDQPITVRGLAGWRNDLLEGSKGTACTSQITGVSTQKCVFPNSKTITYQCANGFSASQLTECQNIIDAHLPALNSQFNAAGYSFSRVTSGGLVQISNVHLNNTVSQTSILPYVNPTGTISTAMGEPSTNFQGTYHVYFNMQPSVDWEKVNANFNTVVRRANVRNHTISAALAWGAGLGLQSFDATRRNAIVITPDAAKVANYHATDQCRVNGYLVTPANIVEFGPGCG